MQQWNEIFKKEGKVFVKPQEDIPRITDFFKKKKIKKILDLGCGSGRHLVYFAERGFKVYGIDISTHGLKIARKWLKGENLKANLKLGNIYEKLPYPTNFFDAIVSTQTIHHNRIEKIRKLIKEIERILKPKGLVFITVRKAIGVKGWRKNKIVIHTYKIGKKKKKVYYKVIAPHLYTCLEGGEKGLPHFEFTKNMIKKEFKNFRILSIWKRKGYYCFLGELKK